MFEPQGSAGTRNPTSCSLKSCSKDSHWSSCWTSLTQTSCFSRAACSLAALSSASASAFLRASTSVVSPNKNHGTLVSTNHSSFLNIYKVIAYLDYLPAAFSRDRAPPRSSPESASVRRPQQCERSQPAATAAYLHRHVRLVSCENYLILCSAFLSEHQRESQGLLSIL